MTTTCRLQGPAPGLTLRACAVRVAAATALVLALGACGAEEPGAGPETTEITETTQEADGVHRDLGIFTGRSALAEGESAEGGALGLPDADAVREWAKGLGLPSPVVGDMTSAAREADVQDGETLAVTRLHVGCAVATSYEVQVVDRMAVVVPEVPESDLKCLVPETSVALLVLDADLADRAADRNAG